MSQYVNLNPFALVAVFLLVITIIATNPRWKVRARRRAWLAARRDRRSEDAAWRNREGEAAHAAALNFARYDREQMLGTGSLRVLDREEFALGLGEIDGGGE